MDLGARCSCNVDLVKRAAGESKSMGQTICVYEPTGDLARVVDALCPGEGGKREINGVINSAAQQEPMSCPRGGIEANDVAIGIDAACECTCRSRKVDDSESPAVIHEAMGGGAVIVLTDNDA